MNFIAIDVETAQGKRHSICQIGLVEYENGKIIKTYDRLVQPPDNYYFYRNIQIHGISADDTKNEPFFPEIWAEIEPMITGKLLVAHNASFDMSCLRKALEYYKLPIPEFNSACTYKMTKMNLKLACQTYDINLDNHHDALTDAKACGEIYLKIVVE